MKAELSGSVPDGVCYQKLKILTTQDIQWHVGIYILQGLSISLQLEIKFNPKGVEKVHGNDFVYNSFGPNENCHENMLAKKI